MKRTNIQTSFDAAKKIPVHAERLALGRSRLENYIALRPIKGLSEQVVPQQTIPFTYLLKLKPMIPLVLIVAVLFGGSGAVVAAQNDLPGDALYGVKIATENVKEAFAFSAEKKAEVKAKTATHRTEELAALSKQDNKPSKEVVTEITTRFQKLLKEINDLTSQLTPEQKLQLSPEVTALVSSSLHDLREARVAGATSTHTAIDEAVQSTLQAELEMSEHEESAVKEQPSLVGLQHRAENKIREVTHKIAETKKELSKRNTNTSTTALLAEAEAALADAQTKYAAGAYADAFVRAGDAQQAAIKAKRSMEQLRELSDDDNDDDSDDNDEVKKSDNDRDESDRESRKKQNEEKKHEEEKLRETNRALNTTQDSGDHDEDEDNEVDD